MPEQKGRLTLTAGPLWDSYNFADASLSKTYGAGGTSQPSHR
jgi:hypothetical protein